MRTLYRLGAILAGAILIGVAVWGGVGFLSGQSWNSKVTVTITNPLPTVGQPTTPTVKVPCPDNKPGQVIYYADQSAAAQYHDFGTPLVPGLSPLYEPTSTPRPSTQLVVSATWTRLCHDPVLTRAVVAAAEPRWSGNHAFNWTAALRVLAQIKWSTAKMVFHTSSPTPWTMMMVSNSPHGPPATFIVHAPFDGWYLEVNFQGHQLVLRAGCGDQPVLTLHGYQAPLQQLFPTA